MAPRGKDTSKDGLLSDSNSIPLCKIPIEKGQQLEDVYDVEAKPFARGKFATVKRCIHRTTKTAYAAKYIKKRRMGQDVTHEVLHEVRVLLLAAKSDRIVQLHQVFDSLRDYILVLELAAGGELQRVLDEEEFLPENTSRHVMRQVLEGISFLHSHQVAHLDIKPQNILLTRPLPCCDIKICDFGISRLITQGSDLREIIGTPDYVAPEILNYEPISLFTDMWSLGCLAYVLLTGCSPFGGEDKQETFCNITTASLDFPVQYFGEVSEKAIDFIRALIVKEPKKRLSCSEAQNHEWLATSSSSSLPLENITPSTQTSTGPTKTGLPTNDDLLNVQVEVVDSPGHNNNNHINLSSSTNKDSSLLNDDDEDQTTNGQRRDDEGLPSTDEDDRLSSASSSSS